MDYRSAMNYLNDSYKFGSKLGLSRIAKLLDMIGNPQDKLKFIHVAGTNGKGSTVSFISSVLIESGYKVGIFTSPFIQRFSERIKINKDEISEEEIVFYVEKIKEKIDVMLLEGYENPTEFEIVTAISFMHYEKNKCDIVVLEVGIGGLYDSTNIIKNNEVAVITSISYDHTEILGNTLEEIAFQKAGIIKNGCPVVLYNQTNQVFKVISEVCKKENAQLYYIDEKQLKVKSSTVVEQVFDFERYLNIKISMIGSYQMKNAIVALKVIDILINKGYKIPDDKIYSGLYKTHWAGRFEKLSDNPIVIIDGAHNIEGASTLAKNLESLYGDKKTTFVFGVLQDKDYKSIVECVNHLADKYITLTPNSPRALKSKDLANFLKNYNSKVFDAETVVNAMNIAIKECKEDEIICVFGSLYFIGQVREYFNKTTID